MFEMNKMGCKVNMKAFFGVILGMLVSFAAVSAAEEHNAKGKINSIDRSSKTLNISHDAIKSMGMSAMTMDFRVIDPAMLDEVKPGQTINFVVTTDRRGRFVVLDLE